MKPSIYMELAKVGTHACWHTRSNCKEKSARHHKNVEPATKWTGLPKCLSHVSLRRVIGIQITILAECQNVATKAKAGLSRIRLAVIGRMPHVGAICCAWPLHSIIAIVIKMRLLKMHFNTH